MFRSSRPSQVSDDESSGDESEGIGNGGVEGDNVISFRNESHSWEDEDEVRDSEEGDLGLGADNQTDSKLLGGGGGYQRGMGYQKLAASQESAL